MMATHGGADPAAFLERARREVESRLDEVLPVETTEPTSLHRSMRYSVFSGGKRLRPALVYAAALCGGGGEWDEIGAAVHDGAAAVELVHTYSLIHDDLPCMDDDDFRRGKPTNHKVFGEAVALLAGDALLTLAFEILAGMEADADEAAARVAATRILARAAGAAGMVGGQVADIESEGAPAREATLESIHGGKTAALIAACLELGAVLVGTKASEIKRLGEFGRKLGLAFQTVDDILGEVGESGTTGKPVGSDAARGKMTAVRVLGVPGAEDRARGLLSQAVRELEPFGARSAVLRVLAEFAVTRKA